MEKYFKIFFVSEPTISFRAFFVGLSFYALPPILHYFRTLANTIWLYRQDSYQYYMCLPNLLKFNLNFIVLYLYARHPLDNVHSHKYIVNQFRKRLRTYNSVYNCGREKKCENMYCLRCDKFILAEVVHYYHEITA